MSQVLLILKTNLSACSTSISNVSIKSIKHQFFLQQVLHRDRAKDSA